MPNSRKNEPRSPYDRDLIGNDNQICLSLGRSIQQKIAKKLKDFLKKILLHEQEQSTIDNMIHRILTHMLSLIRCERAMLLLVHEGSQNTFSRIFDLESSEIDNAKAKMETSSREGRFPVNAGITGYVAATCETVNIQDAYSNHR